MKFRAIFFIVITSFCSIALWAMSPEERAEFKRQLKTATTSAKMEDMVRVKSNIAVLGGLYYCWAKKSDKQNNEDEVVEDGQDG